VCRQVLYHRDLAYAQQQAIGADRFLIVSYEEFCRDPGRLVQELAQSVLGVTVPTDLLPRPIPASRAVKLRRDEFILLERAMDRVEGRQADPSLRAVPRVHPVD
jgi:hypothetical protein